MNADLFASARAKLGRAREHLDTLNREVYAWGEREMQPLRVYFETDGPWHVLYSPPLPFPPDSLVLIAGDMISNARASLDHTIDALVRKRGNTPTRATAFPVCDTEKEWCQRVVCPPDPKRSPLWGVDPKGTAWAIIRQAQPYVSPYGAGSPVGFISGLANRDKHQSLLAQTAFPDPDAVVGAIRWAEGAILLEQIVPPLDAIPFGKRTELLRLRFDPNGPDPEVRVEGGIPLNPMIGDETRQAGDAGYLDILDRLGQLIEQIATAQ